jgi:hypothetical protein
MLITRINMTLNDKQVSRQIDKRRSSIVNKMNAFIAQKFMIMMIKNWKMSYQFLDYIIKNLKK